jgi:hypothetical protein
LFATIIVRFFAPGRGIEIPASFMADIDGLLEKYSLSFPQEYPGVWLCHGHLGEEVMGHASHLAAEFGLPVAICDRIEKADKNVRHRYFCDYLRGR